MITDNSSGFWRVISIFQVLNLQGLHVTATFNRSWTVVDVALVATWCIIGACSDNELSKKESYRWPDHSARSGQFVIRIGKVQILGCSVSLTANIISADSRSSKLFANMDYDSRRTIALGHTLTCRVQRGLMHNLSPQRTTLL